MNAVDLAACGFRGVGRRMTAATLGNLASLHSYPLDMLEAALDVESSGAGYDDAGRPKLLTEPHIFWRKLGPGPKRDQAAKMGLAYPTQGMQPYPATISANYARLGQWIAIDGDAALQSTSWGCAQVMGFNFATCGYASAADMVRACMDDETAQFELLLRYAAKNGLSTAIRNRDTLTFARVYNGPGNAEAYSAKLQKALARHSGQEWTLPPAARAPALRNFPVSQVSADSLNDAEYLRLRSGS